MMVNLGALPVGALIGGLLGTWVGLRTTMWIMMVAFLFTGLILLFSRIAQVRDLPDHPAEELGNRSSPEPATDAVEPA